MGTPLSASGPTAGPLKDRPAERQTLLGLVFLLFVAVVTVFVVWLARVQFARDFAVYDVQLTGQVQGLSKGSAVMFNGVRTGEVTDVALDPKDPSRVVARIQVSADSPVRRNTIARLEWMGLSGTRIIQLSGGALSEPLLKEVVNAGEIPVIRGAQGPFDRNNPEGKSVAVQALDALDNLNQRLSDRNLTAIGDALVSARTGAATWRKNTKILPGVDAQLLATSQNAEKLSQMAQTMNGRMNGDLRDQVEQLADASADAKGAIRNVRGQLAQARVTGEARLQALPAVTSQIEGVAGMVAQAGEVVDRFDNPQTPLLGAPASKPLKVAP